MRLTRFWHDKRGSAAPLLALAALPLLGFVGAAVDYSRANSARSAMQAALDATVLMLAKTGQSRTDAELAQLGQQYLAGNLTNPAVTGVATAITTTPIAGGISVEGSATASINTQFIRIAGFETLQIRVRSAAVAISDGLGCVLALSPNSSGAITSQGSSSIALNNCSLYDNSANATALVVGGSSRVSALSVGVVGGVSGANNITSTYGVSTGMAPLYDPYGNDTFPAPPANCQNQSPLHTTQTLSPAFYCGLTLNADANVTLNPGVYYIGRNGLSVNGNATLSGTGVTLVFTASNGSYGGATINGGATVYLTAPNAGPTAGIVIFGDPNMPTGTSFKLNGGASQFFGGAVYVPKGAVEYSGGASTSTSCTQIIGNTVTFTGNSNVAINCSSYKTKPFSPWVVRLIR